MSTSCKVISIVTILYLANGLINMMLHPGVLPVAQLVYVGCFLVGALAAVTAFAGPAKRYRPLALWSVAPAILVCGTGDWRIVFSGVRTFHLTVDLAWSGRPVFLGVDLVPLLLLVLIWVASEKLIKEQQAAQAPSRGRWSHDHA